MNTESEKQTLLDDFNSYLQQAKLDQAGGHDQPDLCTLLSEMAGLKAEVKVESRQFKTTLDSLNSALTTVQEDNKALSAELAEYGERLAQQRQNLLRSVMLEVVDVYDRLSTGLQVLQNYQPVHALFSHSKAKDVRFIKQFAEGQAMMLRRFQLLLQAYQVRPIDCIGKQLDPLTMTAVETGHDPATANGMVLEELRKGFLIQNHVLRLAEVKVNKLTPGK